LPWQVEALPWEALPWEAGKALPWAALPWVRPSQHLALEGVNESEVRVEGGLPSLQGVVP
jgi:hypothetical protein